ncbi:trypsin-like peptidase domain-containing protein [Thalassotalea sp. LPB0316]|uniref:S1C family serine protease n=1 Tax=Thalassotalea sp. LPB0316 TaxID=2769490 RepID=UPI0018692768|nr:trypsin-like peptidase domain-containing protein [Thalassotalea sp. LPB0316]QOL25080.1 trypsin-like peptidase domain-containing protein [Thalassotalea sp. LPB0316]
MDNKLILVKWLRLVLWLVVTLYLLTLLMPVIETHLLKMRAEPRVVSARGELADSEYSTINIFKQASPSVVYISTSNLVRSYWSRDVRKVPRGTGSGFIWDQFGHVVTNYHVIKGANEASIRLNDGRSYAAKLIGASPNHDLAVLKIDVQFDLPPAVPVGTSDDLQVGQSVFAIGNPFGLDYTLTSGIVSALNRALSGDSELIINNLIQTDAAINPGNSGGPLLDSAGRLIGINTAIFSPSGAYAGIGFAVPVDTVNRVVPQLIKFGHYTRPSLGISFDHDINQQITQQLGISGVAILEIVNNSPAEQAQLQSARVTSFGITLGDVIQAINGKRTDSVKALLSELDQYQTGDNVELDVLRGSKSFKVTVTLA